MDLYITKPSYKNVIATSFETDNLWRKGFFSRKKEEVPGYPNCKKLIKSALYENNGHLIHDSIRKGGINGDWVISNAPLIIDTSLKIFETIEGKSAFIGNLFSQYGHFITEGLSRLYDFKNLSQYDHLLMYPFEYDFLHTEIKDFHKWFFLRLGVDHRKIKIIDKSARIESVNVYSQLWTINYSVDSSLKEIYSFLSKSNMEKINNSKIYLSRRVNRNYNRIDNLGEIENIFSSNGYEILYPEEMSLDKQFSIYSSNSIIVSLSGSIMHNCIFGSSCTKFVEIGDSRTPKQPHIMQELANSISESKYIFIPFESFNGVSWDVKKLNELIKSIV